MKLGIKVGLKGDSYKDLLESRPDFCEVWFNSTKSQDYRELLSKIKQLGCQVGLHYWGSMPDGTLANLCYPNSAVLETSKKQVKHTIDVAERQGGWYVNVHPGGGRLCTVDFEKQEFLPYGNIIAPQTCQKLLEETLAELGEYAKSRGVKLFVESVPVLAVGNPWYGKTGRLKPINLYELQLSHMEFILNQDLVGFTNDFGHTTSNLISDDREKLYKYLKNTTLKFAPKTQLLHVGYLIRPYNGSDYHGCLYYDEFKSKDALPNQSDIAELLQIFADRDDVGALVEPETEHVKNFNYLKSLVQNI